MFRRFWKNSHGIWMTVRIAFSTGDYRVLGTDGSVRWVQHTTILQRDEAGTARTAVAFIVDVTQRKLADSAEREAADRL